MACSDVRSKRVDECPRLADNANDGTEETVRCAEFEIGVEAVAIPIRLSSCCTAMLRAPQEFKDDNIVSVIVVRFKMGLHCKNLLRFRFDLLDSNRG